MAICKIPEGLVRGWSLLATQMIVLFGVFLYHIPTYHLELPGLKKPNSKTSPEEMMVWLCVRACAGVMVSKAVARIGKITRDVKKEKIVVGDDKGNEKGLTFNFPVGFWGWWVLGGGVAFEGELGIISDGSGEGLTELLELVDGGEDGGLGL
ncbi:hypothetical protein RJ640_017567 [Escallonia rubra]|uniref:Uncharacterized protein n=1 Tax=Escallonia rubra TaxID=112253 RepID=A0AA88RKE6_9ASTE|nr:hypothetical protein RJ640_017567 [Escallonia rubra]